MAGVGWAEAASGPQLGHELSPSRAGLFPKESEEVLADRSNGLPSTTRVTAEVISLLMEIGQKKGRVV